MSDDVVQLSPLSLVYQRALDLDADNESPTAEKESSPEARMRRMLDWADMLLASLLASHALTASHPSEEEARRRLRFIAQTAEDMVKQRLAEEGFVDAKSREYARLVAEVETA